MLSPLYLPGSSEQTLQAGKSPLPWRWLTSVCGWSPKPSGPRGQSKCVTAAGQDEVQNASEEAQGNVQWPLGSALVLPFPAGRSAPALAGQILGSGVHNAPFRHAWHGFSWFPHQRHATDHVLCISFSQKGGWRVTVLKSFPVSGQTELLRRRDIKTRKSWVVSWCHSSGHHLPCGSCHKREVLGAASM